MKNPSLRGSSQNQMESCLSALRSVGSYTGCDRATLTTPQVHTSIVLMEGGKVLGFLHRKDVCPHLEMAPHCKGPDVENVKWCIAVQKKAEFHLFGYNFSHTSAYINESISLITQVYYLYATCTRISNLDYNLIATWWQSPIMTGCSVKYDILFARIRSSVFAADTSFCWVFVWWIILPGCLLLVWGYHLGTQFTK